MSVNWKTAYCEPCIVKFTFRTDRPLEDFACHHCGRSLTTTHKRGFIKVSLGTDVGMILKSVKKAKKYEDKDRTIA